MSKNQTPSNGLPWVSPYITVKDVDRSANFYKKAFGIKTSELVPGEDGSTWHGELKYQNQLIMIGKEGAYGGVTKAPMSSGVDSPMNLYVYCEDVDAFHECAVNAGATSLLAPEDTFWGDRMCRLKDIDGYVWSFATALKK